MATGTSNGYWNERNWPSKFKHELLQRYVPAFAGKTAAKDKQIVYVDGYAGEGRYESGESGSAEIAMKVAAHHLQQGLQWSCYFTEKQRASFDRLQLVADEYREQGVDAHVRRGEVDGVLDEVVTAAVGKPLFMFLDPCGLTLPFERLTGALTGARRDNWPPSELLMNFSMMAVRRLGGHVRSDKRQETSLLRFDEVCGGPWWRAYFEAQPVGEPDELVADEYARRLGHATGMSVVTVPVKRAPHHKKPIYLLVFATRSQHGLWSFGDAVARAMAKIWEDIDLADEDRGLLFTSSELHQRPDPEEVRARAVPAMADNMERLLHRRGGQPFELVDHTVEVFGEFYGQVTEPIARKALIALSKSGKAAPPVPGTKTPRLVVRPPQG